MVRAYIRGSDGERVVDTASIANSSGIYTHIEMFHMVDRMIKIKMKEWETITPVKKGTTRVFELPSKAYEELCKSYSGLRSDKVTEAYALGASKSYKEVMVEVSKSIVEHMYDDCPVTLERKRRGLEW